MRTTLDIDDELLEQAMKAAGTTTKKKTVESALQELIRAKRREALSKRIGDYKRFGLSLKDLQRMRSEP